MQLKANNIGYFYEDNDWLFRHMEMTLHTGETVGLVAPSGFGKTTIGKILAGYENPKEGEVTIDGAALPTKGSHLVQLVFQHPEKAVNTKWRMADVLEEGGQIDEDIIHLFGIQKEWLTRFPNEMSGGELQRFCVARALGKNTRFLIADEMTTMLDAITQAQIWHGVMEIAKKGNIGILVISHDLHLVKRLCERVIYL